MFKVNQTERFCVCLAVDIRFSAPQSDKEDIVLRQVVFLTGSGVEDQISEITIFIFYYLIRVAQCLNRSKRKAYD